MHSTRFRLAAGGLVLAAVLPAAAADFDILPLVSDNTSLHPAQLADPGLVNAWGISFPPTGPFWVSSAGTGQAQLYRVDPLTQAVTKNALTVGVPGVPTGQVFNPTAATGAFNGNLFLFVSAEGTISGWRNALGTTAEVLMPRLAGNAYTGAAFAAMSGSSYLYAANFGAGRIDVLKGTAAAPALAGSFVDPNLPAGFSPFNVQNLAGTLYVTYAIPDPLTHEKRGSGLGVVDAFDLQGNFLARVATAGTLDAPWGLAIAPAMFGAQAGSLLVGNFGDGRINIFDPVSHSFLGQVTGNTGRPLEIDELWAITPGNDGQAGSSRFLYFSAGPDEEAHGLFGALVPVPEPATWALMLAGLAAVGAPTRRRRGAGG